MHNQDFISTLQKFGMTERESKLYIAMLEKKEATAADLHRLSGVMRSRTYETLAKMVSKGFCQERVENKRRFFRATRPSELMDQFHRAWEMEQKWRKDASNQMVSVLESKFDAIQVKDQLIDFIEVIRNKELIHQRYITMVNSLTKEVCSFTRSPYACLDPDVLKEQEKAELASFSRGVVNKALYMKEEEHWPFLSKHIDKMLTEGEKVKVTDKLPMKMYIFDQKRVMLALPAIPGHSEADFTMLIVEEPGFTESCIVLFNLYWNQAQFVG